MTVAAELGLFWERIHRSRPYRCVAGGLTDRLSCAPHMERLGHSWSPPNTCSLLPIPHRTGGPTTSATVEAETTVVVIYRSSQHRKTYKGFVTGIDHTHACTCTHMHAHSHAKQTCMNTNIPADIQTDMHTHTHTHACIHTCMQKHTNMHAHAHTHIHMHTHSNTHRAGNVMLPSVCYQPDKHRDMCWYKALV